MNNEVLIKYIIRQIANEVVYRAKDMAVTISFRAVSGPMHQSILEEGRKWGLTDRAIDDLITDVRNNIDHYSHASTQTLTAINVQKDLHAGSIVCLTGRSETLGQGAIRLLFLGASEAQPQPRFMVLESERTALQPEDVLCLCCSNAICVTHRAAFRVVRGGRPVPDDSHLYVTDRLESLSVQRPSLVHEVIDSKRSFTFSEEMALQRSADGGSVLSFGQNPMSLLLHDYSTLLPAYADFEADGTGTFASNPAAVLAPSAQRDLLFGIGKDNADRTLSVKTAERGTLQLVSETLRPVCLTPAQTQVSLAKRHVS